MVPISFPGGVVAQPGNDTPGVGDRPQHDSADEHPIRTVCSAVCTSRHRAARSSPASVHVECQGTDPLVESR